MLGAYSQCGDPRVDAALARALDDPKHKIRHAVARRLGRGCPGCGTRPDEPEVSRAEWHRRLYESATGRCQPGKEGFARDVALGLSPQWRRRREAALRLAMRDEPQRVEHLRRLMADENARVRRHATIGYATAIHPAADTAPLERIGTPAQHVPDGLDALLARRDDVNNANRKVLARLLGDYVPTGDHRVEQLLRKLLTTSANFPHAGHSIRHVAAEGLSVPCPLCTE